MGLARRRKAQGGGGHAVYILDDDTAYPASHCLASALPRQERGLSQCSDRLLNY